LKSKDENLRGHAATVLAAIGPPAKAAVPALAETLREKKTSTVPSNASRALGKIGAPAVPKLIEALKDKQAHVRELAASALKDIGPPARPAVPALIVIAKEQKALMARLFAIDALGRIGPEARE